MGTTWAYPPPAAPPLTPNTGPKEGSRRHSRTFLSSRFSASAKPTLVVVFPSPAGVGLMAVTRISFPFRGFSRRGPMSSFAFTRP